MKVAALNSSLNGPRSFVPLGKTADDLIRPGADVAIIGLFRSHYGANRNIPIIRVGNIAANLGEPVYTAYAGYIQAYLIEARSISGLSGSPVFICSPELNVIAGIARARGQKLEASVGLGILGMMHGHFDVPNLNEDVVSDSEEPERGVHTGIGVVIPVQKVIETIQHPDLTEMRKETAKKLREKGATSDLASDDEALPPASDANSKHREDFNSLLDAAVKTACTKN
jgi:hypothetical protein